MRKAVEKHRERADVMKKSIAIVFVCCAFALMACLTACGGSSSGSAASASSASASASASSASSSSSAEAAAKAEYDRATALFNEGKYYSAKVAFEKSAYSDWEQRAAACVQPMPETGELFHDDSMKSDNMVLAFTVNEQNENMGYYIAVYTKDNKLVETLFVKGTGTVETKIPGGEYYVKDSSGTAWYGEDEQFGADGHYETMVFNEVEGDPKITVLEEGYRSEITINASGGGQQVGSEENSWENRT